ncbi:MULTISPECIES: cupin domain-containing protein [Anaerotruncus]|jgi:mannose-6-phosphate isomerase-like protein (cupin superfamily)|uniref:cupin domain-containing protein n=1 Tax=Anaerotruncus TaxID=244127 RepID=UPI0008333A5D|nr:MULTISPECIES: cupin domain-containing protein [Anaerotruncus]RGX55524.1 cupin domain-containing protein [Anaerotruncus sp. AF02-27]
MEHKVNHFKDAAAVVFDEPKRTSFVQLSTADGVRLGCGGCEVPPHSSNQNHVHDADEVMHVVEGELEFVFADRTEVLGPRDVIYVPAGEWHQIFNRTEKPAYHTYVFSDPACTDLILARYNQK